VEKGLIIDLSGDMLSKIDLLFSELKKKGENVVTLDDVINYLICQKD